MKIMINCDGRSWAKHSRDASHKILIGFMEKIKIRLRGNSPKAMQHVFVMLKWSNEIKTCFNCWLLLIRSISKIVEEFQCFLGISNLANIYLQLQSQSTVLLWRHAPNLWKYLLKGSGEYYNLNKWQYYFYSNMLIADLQSIWMAHRNQDISIHQFYTAAQWISTSESQPRGREGGARHQHQRGLATLALVSCGPDQLRRPSCGPAASCSCGRGRGGAAGRGRHGGHRRPAPRRRGAARHQLRRPGGSQTSQIVTQSARNSELGTLDRRQIVAACWTLICCQLPGAGLVRCSLAPVCVGCAIIPVSGPRQSDLGVFKSANWASHWTQPAAAASATVCLLSVSVSADCRSLTFCRGRARSHNQCLK